MKTYVFDDPKMVDALGLELATWPGTPFFPRMARRGVGADCIQFAFAPLQALGVVGAIEWPRYSVKGGGPELVELIHRRIITESCLREVDRLPLMPGDILLCSDPLHIAIVGPAGDLWQSLHPLGVQHGFLAEAHFEHLDYAYRAEVWP